MSFLRARPVPDLGRLLDFPGPRLGVKAPLPLGHTSAGAMAAKAAPPKAEIDELLDERERQQRVDALVGRVRRDPTLLTSYTWKWRTSVAATHVLLGLVVYHALTRVIVAEARGMIDAIDVHALGLGDGDAGTYTWRQHLVACAQATTWVTLLTLVLVAELTSACNALLGRHAWTPCAFHNILASTRMDATLAMFKTLAVLYLGWFTRTPTLATVFTPEAGDSNKLLVSLFLLPYGQLV